MMDDACHIRGRLSEGYALVKMMSTKRFSVREELDGFEPVSLPLTVVAVNNINARRPINLAFEIAEVQNLYRIKKHIEILSYERCYSGSLKTKRASR